MNQISSIQPAASLGSGLDEGFDGAVARMAPVERLRAEKDQLRARYLAAEPYPHLVLDNYFDPYTGAGFDRSSAAARDWFVRHLR